MGFINGVSIFDRDGVYLGWIEGPYVWDKTGKFRGVITQINGHQYVSLNQFQILPIPRIPRIPPISPIPPPPPMNILPIRLPLGHVDGF